MHGNHISFDNAHLNTGIENKTSFDFFVSTTVERALYLERVGENKMRIKGDRPATIKQDGNIIEYCSSLSDFEKSLSPCWHYDGENIRIKHRTETLTVSYEDKIYTELEIDSTGSSSFGNIEERGFTAFELLAIVAVVVAALIIVGFIIDSMTGSKRSGGPAPAY